MSSSKSPTSTVVGTPRPALNSSGGVDNNFDLVTTSSFEEWSHSQGEHTVVVSEWNSSGGDVKLHTDRECEGTIVGRFLGSIGGERVEWETERDLEVGISDGDLDGNVEMHEGLDGSCRGSGSTHSEEDIDEFLGR
jgi:hypothetical protein